MLGLSRVLRSRSGNAAIMMIMVIAVVLIVVLFILPQMVQNQACANNPLVKQPAEELAADIIGYPTINGTDCGLLLQEGNKILANMNLVLNTSLDQADANLVCSTGIQIAPVVGSYDELILSARAVTPDNATSISSFYENLFLLAADFFILNSAADAVAYKVAFKSTGELNDGLKLGKIVSLCGDSCYSALLSQIHWIIRDNFNGMLGDFENWAARATQPNSC